MADLDGLRRTLGSRSPGDLPPGDAPGRLDAAAVLVPFVAGPAGWYLLLIRRTEGVSTHRGEIAFPGGRVEPGESSLDAALRETHEELGIAPGEIDVLGPLPGVGTNVSGFWIVPWVGVVAPEARAGLVANPDEVAAVLDVPLDGLASPGCRREQRFIRGRRVFASPAYDTAVGTIWGATARIVEELLAGLAVVASE